MDILCKINKAEVVLASGSPRRSELLSMMGIKFNVRVSNKEEIPSGNTPEEIVEALSKQKTESVANDILKRRDDEASKSICIVIGSDTAVFNKGVMLGKPLNIRDAHKMIGDIQGNTHQVYTGVTIAIIKNNNICYESFSEKTDVTVVPMSKEEIECYVNLGESLDKAGGYGLQGAFSMFISGISGDHNNVIGLPVAALYKKLKEVSERYL